jgi:hypothetical protein
VKKQLALFGATTLGLSSVALAAPTVAFAADGLPCLDATGHTLPSGGDNTYLACVPQYGLGKVEFQIDSDIPFPASFDLSDRATTTTTSTTLPAGQTYFDASSFPEGFTWLQNVDSAATSEVYQGAMIFKISSVTPISIEAPEACAPDGETYEQAWRVTYLPTTVHTTTTIDGVVWEYDITMTPSPLSLYLNFIDGGSDFAADEAQCATDGTSTEFWDGVGGDDLAQILGARASMNGIPDGPVIETIKPFFNETNGNFGVLGTFSRIAPAAGPSLPTMGIDAAVPAGIAGGLGVLGLALVLVRRRWQTRG